MISHIPSGRGFLAAIVFLVAAITLMLAVSPAMSGAAEPTKGSATLSIASGKAGKVSAIAPARVVKRLGSKGARLASAARKGSFDPVVSSGLAGGIKLGNESRVARITGLIATIKANRSLISGKLGGKRINVFQARGKARIDRLLKTARVSGAKLSLTPKAAARVRKLLGLSHVPSGTIGRFSIRFKVGSVDRCEVYPNSEGCPVIDPYLAECNVEAVVKVAGNITPAGPPPEFTNAPGATGPSSLAWGFKQSFRNYVTMFNGTVHALDGATTTGSPPAYSGFNFPADGFRYTDSGTNGNLADDKAVLAASGTALICNPTHGFRVAISNPTVIIDGSNSRIDADVDNNLSGNWIPSQHVTIATIDITGKVSRTGSGEDTVQAWTGVEPKLTLAGSQAVCGSGELDKCSQFYPAGTTLDPVTIEVHP